MIIGQKATLLPLDEKYVEVVRNWVNQPDVRSGTGSEGPVSDFEHRKWYEQVMSDRHERVFGIGNGRGEGAVPVGLIGLKHITIVRALRRTGSISASQKPAAGVWPKMLHT